MAIISAVWTNDGGHSTRSTNSHYCLRPFGIQQSHCYYCYCWCRRCHDCQWVYILDTRNSCTCSLRHLISQLTSCTTYLFMLLSSSHVVEITMVWPDCVLTGFMWDVAVHMLRANERNNILVVITRAFVISVFYRVAASYCVCSSSLFSVYLLLLTLYLSVSDVALCFYWSSCRSQINRI